MAQDTKSKDQLFHELFGMVCKMTIIVQEMFDGRGGGREEYLLQKSAALLEDCRPHFPTIEQLKEWEANAKEAIRQREASAGTDRIPEAKVPGLSGAGKGSGQDE